MLFEFNHAKSQGNKQKHGIDFEEAQVLWADENHIELTAMTMHESRWICIGQIKDKLWTAVITRRENITRIISVRRSREKERGIYENQGF